jgi:C-terminal processing protease CtpA/Prc
LNVRRLPGTIKYMKTRLVVVIGLLALAVTILAEDVGSIGLVIVDRSSDKEPLRTGVVYSGSPAERAGIKPNGFLISVNGTNVVRMSGAEAASIVRGPVGTSVTLEITDSTMSHTNKFTVTRKRAVFSGYGADMKVEFFDH